VPAATTFDDERWKETVTGHEIPVAVSDPCFPTSATAQTVKIAETYG
jgi:hypothetical protein